MVFSTASPAAAEVADYLGKPVVSVHLALEGRDTVDPALLQVVETRVGQPLSMFEVRESVAHLFSLGRFDDVRVDASVEGNGVALRYELSPIRLVSRIELKGHLDRPGVDEGQLRRMVVARYGASPPLGRVNELAQALVDTMRERGYRRPTVQPRADVDRDSQQTVLVFTIDPGMRTTIRTIEIAGMPLASREELLDRLDLRVGRPFEADVLAARIARYVDTSRSHGYYEATITPSVSFADNDRSADLTLSVSPGPLVRVVFTGDRLPADTQKDLVPIEREGSADEDLLEDSSNRIEEYLRGQGYRDAKAPHTRVVMDNQLTVTFDVRRGPQYRVGRVEVSGNAYVPTGDLAAVLRTREGRSFTEMSLSVDQTAIETLYRERGFTSVRVQADPGLEDSPPDAAQIIVAVSFHIVEGVRTVVGVVRIEGNASVPDSVLRARLGLQSGTAYFDAQLRRDRDAIQLEYANRGYPSVSVDAQPGFSAGRADANPVFVVREGPRMFVGHILITGNLRTSARTIERELLLKPGDPLSLSAELESQRRLAALQLFRRAPQITEVRHGDESMRDLLVTVEEALPTTLGYGGGLEGRLRVVSSATDGDVATQRFEIAPRAFIDLGRRNLFGKNRSINLFASASLHPDESETSSRVGYGFAEYSLRGTFHEPRVFESALDGVLTGTLEQQLRSSFNFARKSATGQLSRRLTNRISVSGAYQLQQTHLLDVRVTADQQPLIDRVFSQVRLSLFSVQGVYDTRDDAVDASRGEYLAVNTQLAARAIGSEVGFLKSFVTGQLFRPVPRARGMVLAVQARLGLATGFPRDVTTTDPDTGEPRVDTVRELPEPERFFAGGDTTVRGFALDTLGRPDTISKPDTSGGAGFPLGGNAETIFNAELRVPVRGGLGVVGFVDTGNVFKRVVDVNLADLRSAVGVGLRYKSPVGPIRVDLGFKLKPEPGESLTAWFISFGQAF